MHMHTYMYMYVLNYNKMRKLTLNHYQQTLN